jgi:hypothetical protein
MTPATLPSLSASEAAALPPPLYALWHDAQGDWAAAHSLVDHLETPDACWVHAYLHRKQGNASNAAYWYGRAGQPVFTGSLDEEWSALASAFLAP